MQATITAVTDVKTDKRGTSCKVTADGKNYFVNEDCSALVGKTVEMNTEEKTSKAGNKYTVGRITKVLDTPASNGNGKVSWPEYRTMAELAHKLSGDLEPDI